MDISFKLLLSYGLSSLRVLVLLLLGYYGTGWLKRKIQESLASLYPDELRSLFIARIAAYAFLFVVIAALLHEFGLNLAALLGAAGVIGFAIAYASQTSVSNIISGLFLTLERPFELHDLLVVDGVEARVETINLFAVTLRTSAGTLMRVPNEQLLKHTFVNLTRLPIRRYDIMVKVHADQDLARVVDILEKTLQAHPLRVDTPPRILIQELSGNYIKIHVGIWVKQHDIAHIQKRLPLEIKQALDKHGIKMAVYLTGECHGA